MQKNYILDTNILIHDPQSIFSFQDNNLYVPIYVLEELDRLKSEQSLRGRNSREACRLIDDLRCAGHLAQGVDINEGGKFIVYVPTERMIPKVAIDINNMDNAILQSALDIKTKSELNTILVTMDVNLRIRADSLGLQTESYESNSVDINRMRSGYKEIQASDTDINELFITKEFEVESDELADNTCVMLKSESKSALCRFLKSKNKMVPLHVPKEGIMGIRPRNREQQFALDMLLDDDVKLITLVGIAGTGKTLLASAVGLSKVLDGTYSRLLISRPVIPMGKDIGFLPGSLREKLDPWMQPVYDNIELLMMQSGKKYGVKYDDLFDQDIIKIEPLTYIRGRSIPKQFMLIDEAQNLSPHEIKTIITRCGEGTKIVLTGDPDQIDNPYMDKGNCGLSVAVEKLQDNPLVGHLILSKGERSELANLAAIKM